MLQTWVATQLAELGWTGVRASCSTRRERFVAIAGLCRRTKITGMLSKS
jgi:hypothetical protein